MEVEFWLKRWEKNEIGFHQNEINVHLQEYWQRLHLRCSKRIFVPLCGKSRDMLWFLSEGYSVLGVEISPLAVKAFFDENNLQARKVSEGRWTRWSCGLLEILCGDFFDLSPAYLEGVGGVYDRASLIALPPEMRKRYSRHLGLLLPEKVRRLLITLEYPQKEMKGPPFAVAEEDVRVLYGHDFDIQKLHEQDALKDNPFFKERGLTYLTEKVYFLNPR